MSKSASVTAKRKTAPKGRRRSPQRASPLAIVEPRLRVPRSPQSPRVENVEPHPKPNGPLSSAQDLVTLMFAWSPMTIALRQQAMFASLLSTPSRDDPKPAKAKPVRRKAESRPATKGGRPALV